MGKFKTVEEYLSTIPEEAIESVERLRTVIREVVPDAEEVISYDMPGFRKGAMLVWYAAWKQHIGFYPTNTPIEIFKEELSGYKTSKGAIQFAIGEPIPVRLVKKIVKMRLEDVAAKSKKVRTRG